MMPGYLDNLAQHRRLSILILLAEAGAANESLLYDCLEDVGLRPNVMVIGQAPWTKLRSNPAINKAVNRTGGDKGMASKQALLELFELEDIQVGQGFVNTAKPGQAATFSRVWGKSCALIHRNKLADARGGVTFGWTAQFKDRIAMEKEDSDIGLEGGIAIRVGEYVEERLVAADVGYLFSAAIS